MSESLDAGLELEVDKVERNLRKRIVDLELAPGRIISVANLMKLTGSGRTPLRLALERLSEQGLVLAQPNHGFSIAPMNLDEFSELYDFIINIETYSARLAAERFSAPEDSPRLEEILVLGREAVERCDYWPWVEYDLEMHSIMARISQNRFVIGTMDRLYNLLRRYLHTTQGRRPRATLADYADAWYTEMRALVDALHCNDSEGAARCIRAHNCAGRDRTRAFL